MARLSAHLGGPTLWIKRDDCTGLATGGNKTRKLEFLVADALAQGADTLITLGALQSNHARQTAAAAAKLGLKCVLVLEERVSQATDAYRHNGNVLLDRLLGATVKYVPRDSSMTTATELAADDVRRSGGRAYVVPGGGLNAMGALGYVGCALEILQQAGVLGVRIDRAVHATGSSGTQAGLIAGFDGMRSGVRVLGITVGRPRDNQEKNVARLLDETWAHLGMTGTAPHDNIEANDNYFGEAYGIPTPAMKEAVGLLAQPGGPVEESFFRTFLSDIEAGLAAAGPLDAVFISAHGAALAEGTDDPDGDLFEVVRKIVGPDIPVVAVFDLHANVSHKMIDNLSVFVGYLENPHTDIYERGVEAAKHMRECLAGARTVITMVKVPLVPPQISLLTAKGPYADLIKYGQTKLGGDILNVSVMAGFAYNDSPHHALTSVVTARHPNRHAARPPSPHNCQHAPGAQ